MNSLQGKRVFITPNVKPDTEVVESLVKAAHGQVLYVILWSLFVLQFSHIL